MEAEEEAAAKKGKGKKKKKKAKAAPSPFPAQPDQRVQSAAEADDAVGAVAHLLAQQAHPTLALPHPSPRWHRRRWRGRRRCLPS